MSRITVRGLDESLLAALRAVAKEKGVSQNQAALQLLRQGAGLPVEPSEPRPMRPLDEILPKITWGYWPEGFTASRSQMYRDDF